MVTVRDIAVATAAAFLTLSLIAQTEQKQGLQRSAVFDWNSIPPKPTESGSVRPFFKGPTATLDSLDIHVSTLDPGKAPHPPHKHLNEELVIVKEGTLEVLENGETKTVGSRTGADHHCRYLSTSVRAHPLRSSRLGASESWLIRLCESCRLRPQSYVTEARGRPIQECACFSHDLRA